MNNSKNFGILAFERLISNLLSVKVWLFLIPTAAAAFFMWWCIDLIEHTVILSQKMTADNPQVIMELSKEGMSTMKDLFTAWLKFTGSLVVTIGGIREVWKVSKIKEETRRKKIDKENG